MSHAEGAMRPTVKGMLLLASLAGAAYCLLNAAGAELLCITEGCRIYAGYGLFGLSFYVYGAGGFLAIFLLTLFSRLPFAGTLLWLVLFAALLLNTGFLAWQSFFWPCSSCLVAALLLGLTVLAALAHFRRGKRSLLAAAGIVWLVFFLSSGLGVIREVVLVPWPAYGTPAAPVKVFFSPDCPACERTVREILDDPQAAETTAFYPIAKGAEDRRRLAAFVAGTGEGADALPAFTDLFQPSPGAALPLDRRTRLRLLANKIALARTGASTVPLVISPGLLRKAPAAHDFNPFAETPLFPGTGTQEGCSAFEETPCD